MIFGFLKVAEKISHVEAFSRADLRSKRMGNKTPNGNILVEANGRYSRYILEGFEWNQCGGFVR
jgi:hypothetical protein